MQLTKLLLTAAAIFTTSEACYFIVHSSRVGDFRAQHSEPKDHGGAPQTLTGSHNGCSFRADLADGCRVTVESEHGCGSLSFQRVGDN